MLKDYITKETLRKINSDKHFSLLLEENNTSGTSLVITLLNKLFSENSFLAFHFIFFIWETLLQFWIKTMVEHSALLKVFSTKILFWKYSEVNSRITDLKFYHFFLEKKKIHSLIFIKMLSKFKTNAPDWSLCCRLWINFYTISGSFFDDVFEYGFWHAEPWI